MISPCCWIPYWWSHPFPFPAATSVSWTCRNLPYLSTVSSASAGMTLLTTTRHNSDKNNQCRRVWKHCLAKPEPTIAKTMTSPGISCINLTSCRRLGSHLIFARLGEYSYDPHNSKVPGMSSHCISGSVRRLPVHPHMLQCPGIINGRTVEWRRANFPMIF